jgi:hypothetical protein
VPDVLHSGGDDATATGTTGYEDNLTVFFDDSGGDTAKGAFEGADEVGGCWDVAEGVAGVWGGEVCVMLEMLRDFTVRWFFRGSYTIHFVVEDDTRLRHHNLASEV